MHIGWITKQTKRKTYWCYLVSIILRVFPKKVTVSGNNNILQWNEMCNRCRGWNVYKRYTTRSRTSRWPMVHFQNLLDVTGANMHTIMSFTSYRSSTSSRLILPHSRRKTLDGRAFPSAAAKIWNGLPAEVASVKNISCFKKKVKNFLLWSWFCMILFYSMLFM